MKKYYSSLDTLRAIAVLSVIFYHTIPQVFSGGFLGVNLFFVLSGYLMTSNIIMELFSKDSFNFKRFYQRRIARIYPSLLFLLGILTLFIGLTNSVDPLLFFKDSLFSLLGINNQWQLINQVSYFDQFKGLTLLKHLWSLSIEMQFYLFYPLLLTVIFFKQKKKYSLSGFQRVLIILTVISCIIMSGLYFYVDINFAYYSTLSRLASFTIGGLFFIKSGLRKKKKNNYFPLKVTLCLLLMLFLLITLTDHSLLTYNGGILAFNLISGYLIFFMVLSKRINHFFDIPLLTTIGKRSYDMYLFYLPTILIFEYYAKWEGKFPYLVTLLLTLLIMTLGNLAYNITQKTSRKKILLSFLIVSVSLASVFIFAPINRVATTQKRVHKPKQVVISPTMPESTKNDSIKDSSASKTKNSTSTTKPRELFFIGDSVLLGASEQLNTLFESESIEIDAKVGRQLYDVQQIIENHSDSENLIYILSTGNNGLITKEDIKHILDVVGDHSVYFITTAVPRSWKTTSNDTLKKEAKQHNNMYIIDWETTVINHPDNNWFDGDEIHLNTEGGNVYTELIQSTLENKKIE